MKITLLSSSTENPIDISVGSARSCYSSKIKMPEDIKSWPGKFGLAMDLKKSGHHTTLQHANFTFALEGVSRLAIWRFFHAHRFYNSDQVSQRYAKIDKENYFLESGLDNDLTLRFLHLSLIKAYEEISVLLEEDFSRSKNKVHVKIANKKAMENARYILPQSTLAHMYHTVNLSTLMKYYKGRTSNVNANYEIDDIVGRMVSEVVYHYPELGYLFESIDKDLDKGFKVSNKLNPAHFIKPERNVEILNNPFLDFNTDPSFYADTDGMYFLFNTIESTETVKLKMNISLSADSQNQRHRTSSGIREDLNDSITKNTDTFEQFTDNQYIPDAIRNNKEAYDIFIKALLLIYNELKITSSSYAPYILPNSHKVVIVESTNYSDLIHKTKTRLCLNAQDEIRFLTEEMVSELTLLGANVDMFAPPCVFNFISNIKPTCTEGSRFCGIKEWKNSKYANMLLKYGEK